MILPITSHIYSVDDRAYMLDKLSRLEQGAFVVKKSFDDQVHEQFSLTLAESLLNDAREAQISLTSATDVQKFLKDTQTKIRSLPMITLRIAFLPTNDLVRSIAKWFDGEFKRKTIVGIVVDSALIGGVAIEWDGKYLDYSLKKLLQEKLSIEGKVDG